MFTEVAFGNSAMSEFHMEEIYFRVIPRNLLLLTILFIFLHMNIKNTQNFMLIPNPSK
jgi:hypothetical protein